MCADSTVDSITVKTRRSFTSTMDKPPPYSASNSHIPGYDGFVAYDPITEQEYVPEPEGAFNVHAQWLSVEQELLAVRGQRIAELAHQVGEKLQHRARAGISIMTLAFIPSNQGLTGTLLDHIQVRSHC